MQFQYYILKLLCSFAYKAKLHGVVKKDINLKMHEDSFNLTAPREDYEFVTTLSMCCPIDPEKAKAKYENGLLKIEELRAVLIGKIETAG